MASLETTIPMSELTKKITVQIHIKGLARWKVQAWVGTRLFRLGAWLMKIGLEIDE